MLGGSRAKIARAKIIAPIIKSEQKPSARSILYRTAACSGLDFLAGEPAGIRTLNQ